MEQTKIDEFMRSRGFTKAIGPIFSEWEFVKDEILLPDRKEGTGNGTVHIYLLEDNMDIFKQCFSEYIEAFNKAPKESEEKCPHVAHFVMTSNVLTVAGFAYMHYKCDANMFNYANFVHQVMRNDDDGMIAFESLFKFTTENRPYFKQFDKEVFSKIIRYVFVPRKTAYKIYLYSDDEYKNFATFWIIGQIPDNTFIVDSSAKPETRAIPNAVEKNNDETVKVPVSMPDDVKQRFISFIVSQGYPLKTAKSYAGNVKNMIPVAQNMLDGQEHPSPFTITNVEELQKIEKDLWSNKEIAKWNAEKHHRASAALSMYVKMFLAETSDNTEIGEVKKPRVAHVMDFTLTKEEEEQKENYMKFLREERGMVSMSTTNYANMLYKKLSPLIRDYYNSDFRNVYAVKDLKALMKMDDDIWDIPEIRNADESTKGKIYASFQRYKDFVESTLSDEEIFSIAFANDGEEVEEENNVKLEVGIKYQYAQYLPLYSVRAACGAFANEQEVETEGWVDVSTSGIKAKENMFVVHAKGNSMEPRIHDNDLCVFQKYDGEELENQIVLTQLITHDTDYGGMYTIKKFHAVQKPDEYGNMRNEKVELISYNSTYSPIILTGDDADYVKTVGVFVDVLRGSDKDAGSVTEDDSQATKRKIIRVEYPNGKVVQNTKSKDTFLEVIKDSYPDLIMGIDFSVPFISREKLPDFPNHPRSQTIIDGGYYVSTNFSNLDKVKILKKISDELELGLRITLVDKE